MVLSHEDIDHSGGAQSIINEIAVNKVMSSDTDISLNQDIQECLSGQKWVWDGVKFEILSPQANYFENDNNRSCVLRVSNKYHSLLLVGDIQKKVEKLLIRRLQNKIRTEVLVVPHHGSKTSSSQMFLDAVSPSLSLIPVGYRNRFGHPKLDVLNRFQKSGIRVLDTVQSGAIIVNFPVDKEDVTTTTYRKQHRRFWNK